MNTTAFFIALIVPTAVNVAMIPVYVKAHRERAERRRAAEAAAA